MKSSKLALSLCVLSLVAIFSFPASAELEKVEQALVPPPLLPAHEQVTKSGPKLVKVRMVTEEKRIKIARDAEIWAMTFNGTVPGPALVVHEGDYVEVTLVNLPTNMLAHNIEFHAATGGLGGGELTLISPGQEAVLRFKATKPGVFIYHCAPGGEMTALHVVSGMNGIIMVLPRDGLKNAEGKPIRYDRAYYIGEQDFYIHMVEGRVHRHEYVIQNLDDTLSVMKTLTPTHVVFNGAVDALTGKNALHAKVGEKVLIIHAQANRDSRPHLIGGHADLFWEGGSFSDRPKTNRETWFIPGGSAVAALYEFRQPGKYTYVTHNLIEATLLGALAEFIVEGEWNDDLMKQVVSPHTITQ